MTDGTTPLDEGLEHRRRRLRFRAWHRGTREMDLILGHFVDAALTELSEPDVSELENWLEMPDPDLYAWITGEQPAPSHLDTPLFRRVQRFHRG